MHYMKILKLSDEVIKTYGRYPDERDPGLQSAREIYKLAFLELMRQGMPYTKEAGLLKIETDGEVYAVNKYWIESMHAAPAREEKDYAAHIPTFPYTPQAMDHANDDEDLDVTRVMSFTEAMDPEEDSRDTEKNVPDEEYVHSASDLLGEDSEAAGSGHENKGPETENLPGVQKDSGEEAKQLSDEKDPEDMDVLEADREEDRADSWEQEGEDYEGSAEEPPADEDYEEPPADKDYEEPAGEPEDDEGDGIIIPPEENSMMDEPGAADIPRGQDEPETHSYQENDKEAEDTAPALSEMDSAKETASPPAALSSALQDALFKDDFTYSNGRIIITAPNGAEEKAGILSMPLSMDTGNPEFLIYCAVIGREKKTFVTKGQGEKILTIAGYKVAFSAWIDTEGDYRTSCRLDGDSVAVGAALSYRVKTAGKNGHIVLGDDEGTLRIHAMPTSFKDTQGGEPASVLYYVETLDEESYGVAHPQTPIRFPYENGHIRAGFVWKDGVLNGGIIVER